MLSLRATGLYAYICQNPDESLSAVSIAKHFKEGEKAIRTALNELRDAGLITTRTIRTSAGQLIKVTELVVDSQNRTAENGGYTQLSEPYSQNSLFTEIASSSNRARSFANCKTEFYEEETFHEIGEKMGYEFFGKTSSSDDDSVKERSRYEAKRAEEKRQAQLKRHEDKVEYRDRKRTDPTLWTSSDTAREFANMLHERWDIPPWQVSSTPLAAAIYSARVKFQTDGAVELRMLKMFFAQENVKAMKDPNVMWRYFITSFGSLAERAKLEMPDPEKQRRAEERAAIVNASLFENYEDTDV